MKTEDLLGLIKLLRDELENRAAEPVLVKDGEDTDVDFEWPPRVRVLINLADEVLSDGQI